MKPLMLLAALFVAAPALAAVNVNTAQQSELQRTRGLDKHKAKAIIDYRNQNGPLESLDELEQVRGFTRETIEKLRPELVLSGPPTTPAAAEKIEKIEKAEKPDKPQKKRG